MESPATILDRSSGTAALAEDETARARAGKHRKQDADLANHFLSARSAWDERYGDLIARARHWRMIAFVAMAVAFLAVGGLLIAMRQSRLVPFVIAVNELGRPVASGVATPERFNIEDRIMKVAVADFVTAWRTVTVDWTLQKGMIDKVFSAIAQGTRAQIAIEDWYRNDPPQKRSEQGTVEVEIQSVLATGDKSWEVQWLETKRLASGQLQAKDQYRGILTVAVNQPRTEEEGRNNPLAFS
jgi:type IV secretory pathway TrbF-like protein